MKLIYYPLFIPVFLFSLLPLRVLYGVVGVIRWICYYLIRYRRSVVVQNLTRSFPEKSYNEIDGLAKQFYIHFFETVVEWIKSISESRQSASRRIVFENVALLNDISRKGQPIMLVLGHYGNWESLSILPTVLLEQLMGVYKQQSTGFMDNLSRYWRCRFGGKVVESSELTRFAIEHKQVPFVYYMVADQSPPPTTPDPFTFLHQPTVAFKGVEKLAAKLDAAVVYAEMNKTSRGRYSVRFISLDRSKPVIEQFYRCLEETINRNPAYWLWSHKRWKHKVTPIKT